MPEFEMVKATVWLQVKPLFSPYRGAGQPRVAKGIAITAMTKNAPSMPRSNATIAIKVTVRIPAGVFTQFTPEAVIDVPATMVHEFPVQVEALDPHADYPEVVDETGE